MPTYEYKCESCYYEFEMFHSMSMKSLVDCPECGMPDLVRLISMGLTPIIRGTKTPCKGGRSIKSKKDRLGRGKNKTEMPFWRDGPVDKSILRDPEKYIQSGKVD